MNRLTLPVAAATLTVLMAMAAPDARAQAPGWGPDPGPPMTPGPVDPAWMMPHSPELAHKTAEVLALRRIVRMRLTAQQTASALDALRALQRAEKAARSQAEKALDDERRALLSATGDPPPASNSAQRMREVGDALRNAREAAARALDEAIGPENGRALLSLVQGSMPMMPTGTARPRMGVPPGGPGQPGQPPFPGNVGAPPGGPQPPAGPGMQPGQPSPPAPQPGQPPAPGRRLGELGAGRRPRDGRAGGPMGPMFPGAPGQPGGFLMPPSPFVFQGALAPGALPLDALVELLEKRVAALRS